MRVAENSGGTLYYLLSDHLGSTALTLDSGGNRTTELRYYPYGAVRYNAGNQVTTYRFTGQRWDSGTALYYYGARWFDPAVGRFLAADTIVPQPGNPQSLNRYAYSANNPLRNSDPTGHDWVDAVNFLLGFAAQWASANAWMVPQVQEALSVQPNEPAPMTVGRHLGNVAAVVQGVTEVAAGASVDVGGVGLCLTGIGCLAGAPALVAGTAVAAHGVTVAVAGAATEGQMLGNLLMAGTQDKPRPMLGANGAGFPSKTLFMGEKGRLDVENPSPGKRPGQIHFQEWGEKGGKWYYDPVTNTFLPDKATGALPPASLLKLIKEDEGFLRGAGKRDAISRRESMMRISALMRKVLRDSTIGHYLEDAQLAPRLQRLADSRLLELDGCYILAAQLSESVDISRASGIYWDRTDLEASVSHVHIEDFVQSDYGANPNVVLGQGLLYVHALQHRLRPAGQFLIILSFEDPGLTDDTDYVSCSVRFHGIRDDEHDWLGDIIETPLNAILVVDTREPDLWDAIHALSSETTNDALSLCQ